ncbi:MAG: hypothetical protein IPH08_03715 [Rhodocyclaceae bacterium]|nr:hypothetical protein [Rhodocyclaceae bacterium]
MATGQKVNTELLGQLLASSGVGVVAPDGEKVEVIKPSASAAFGVVLSALFPKALAVALVTVIIYGVGWATIYALRQVEIAVPAQPWWGVLIFGVIAVQIGGRGWKPKSSK